jgi:hypothetical protein
VLELARSIGYELRPGVSAATVLDLRTQATAAPATGPLAAPSQVVVPKGTAVLSVPGPGELPQTFETDDDIVLEAACDEIPLVRTEKQVVGRKTTALYLAGVATGLRAGDAILVVEDPPPATGVPGRFDFRVLRTVDPQPTTTFDLDAVTRVTWDTVLANDYAQAAVYAFGLRAAFFGFNALDWDVLPDEVRKRYDPPLTSTEWPGFEISTTSDVVDLDTPHPELGPGSFLVLSDPDATVTDGVTVTSLGPVLYRVRMAESSAQAKFGVTARTTKVTLDRKVGVAVDRRRTTIHSITRALPLAAQPIEATVHERTLQLDRAVPLVEGRPVLVTGSMKGVPVLEQATIRSVAPAGPVTSVVLDHDPPEMDRDSVRLLGNIVPATHGETVPDEVLGSGDGSVPNQRFTLNKPNVTHLPDPHAPGGVADSLQIFVDGIEWKEVASLYPAGPQDRVYVVRIDDDAAATVIFGDGEHGSRLPTGQENVVARYRSGIGPAGEVGAHTLIVLPRRPPGVASVDNPFAAGGSSPPETLAEARTNAPLTVVTLDRVVGLRDYEDFTRAYGGIAKARASVVRGRTATFLVVTVVGTDGKVVPPLTVGALRDALDARRDRAGDMVVLGYETARFRVGVDVLAAPDRDRAVVEAAVENAVRSAFAVDRRDFGQAVTVAEVLTLVQGVAGVVACRVTDLRLSPPPPPPGSLPIQDVPRVDEVLPARDARFAPTGTDPDHIAPAELLLVDPRTVHVCEMAP